MDDLRLDVLPGVLPALCWGVPVVERRLERGADGEDCPELAVGGVANTSEEGASGPGKAA